MVDEEIQIIVGDASYRDTFFSKTHPPSQMELITFFCRALVRNDENSRLVYNVMFKGSSLSLMSDVFFE